jgi:DNA-binding NarL/FixJ family response regulator
VGIAEHLVGRAEELAFVDGALTVVENGRPAAAAIVGEPGIGKTRLLRELGERADRRGLLVLAGAGAEFERDLPFWVFVDALDEYVGSLDPQRLDALDDQTLAELGQVLSSVPSRDGARLLSNERYRTHRAVRELLTLLGREQPVVLILDDLHWADSGSIELLGALLHRPPAAPLLLALGMRTRHVPERLATALLRAERAGTLARVELGALTLAETGELLGARAAGETVGSLYADSGGNPFYLEQLARALDSRARPIVRSDTIAAPEVPPAVAAALTEELRELPDAARAALDGAAVAGDPFEPELVAAAAGVAEDEAVAALDVLLRSDLIRPTDVPRRFRFRHPLVRRAVYDASPGGWRLGAHQRCAAALAARGASAPARAHHVERSAPQGDAEAIGILREAGAAVAARTPAGAARWFAAALRLLRDDAPPGERIELLASLAGAHAATGQFLDARAALLEALALLPPDEPEFEVRLTAACAGVEQLLGRHVEAHARMVGALEALDDDRSPQAASLMISLALDAFFRQEHEASETWSLRALEAARATGEVPLIAAAAAAVALALAFVEDTERALPHSAEAATLVDGMSDEQLAVRLDAVAYLVGAEAYLDRFDEATGHGRRGLRLARETGQGALLPMLIQATMTSLAAQGRLQEAAELLDGAIEGARLAGNDQTLAWDLLNRAFIGAQQGDVETTVASAEESFGLTRPLEDSFVSRYSGLLLAIARMEQGEYAEAVELFLGAGGDAAMARVPGGWRAKYLELLTRSLLALGRSDEALETAGNARVVAELTGLRTAAGWAGRATAFVALAADRHDDAVSEALRSAASFEATGCEVEAAVSRLLAGRALARAGERGRAIEELERAVATFEAAGAERFRLEAERELGSLGRRTYRRSRAGKLDGTGLEALTERELELARLVVDRKTNPEIAAELFLSQKTVETHLRNIFRKVGVANRVELARAVERQQSEA